MRTHLFFSGLSCIFTVNSLPAQSWQWAEQGTGDDYDLGIGISTDANENVYATGSFYSSEITFGSTSLVNDAPGFAAAYLVKYDSDGNVIWAAGSEGDGSEEPAGVATDVAGNTIVYGAFGHYGTFMALDGTVLDCTGGADGFIAKYDPSGALQWATGFGGGENDGVNGAAMDNLGNTYATGYFISDSISFGTFTLHRHLAYGPDLFVVELDPDGNVIWARSEGGDYDDVGVALAIGPDGEVIVTGRFGGTIEFDGAPLMSAGGDDVCLFKYTPSGDPVWARTIGGAANDIGRDVTTDADGNIYVAGNLVSPICYIGTTLFFNPAYPSTDVFIAKYDPSGSVIWAEHGWGWGWEYIGGISMGADDNLHVAGYFSGDTATFDNIDLINANPGWESSDIFLVTYNASGGLLDAQHPNGANGLDEAYDVAADADGNVFITGYFDSPELIFGVHVLTDPGSGGECFTAKLGAISTIVHEQPAALSPAVFPNPADDFVRITSPHTMGAANFALFDAAGRSVMSGQVMKGAAQLDLAGLAPGSYLLRWEDPGLAPVRVVKR